MLLKNGLTPVTKNSVGGKVPQIFIKSVQPNILITPA